MKNTTDTMDDVVCVAEVESEDDGNNAGCQVRRKIEDILERRRYKDELGELGETH